MDTDISILDVMNRAGMDATNIASPSICIPVKETWHTGLDEGNPINHSRTALG